MKKTEISLVFDLLDDWRLLPAYQLERRADIFFAVYLKQILEESQKNCKVEQIIPEFPVRIGSIYLDININKSYKIDYLAICKNKVFLIELKTDANSRRSKQDEYLEKAKSLNIEKLIDGLLKIFEATASKNKYRRLLSILQQNGWLIEKNGKWQNLSKDTDIEIVYIQPLEDADKDKNIITFEKVASIISKNKTELSSRFAASLQSWKLSADS